MTTPHALGEKLQRLRQRMGRTLEGRQHEMNAIRIQRGNRTQPAIINSQRREPIPPSPPRVNLAYPWPTPCQRGNAHQHVSPHKMGWHTYTYKKKSPELDSREVPPGVLPAGRKRAHTYSSSKKKEREGARTQKRLFGYRCTYRKGHQS